ncbi:MAG TPA: SGNH hydrolase domain-containing protein [Paracoccaceae bacterium]|nr:SGNH hydrolase domain-containing protein [Paracoccaceae bacterium]HMO71080.1 SGNH hydrolase domain-containing protein [Paracoccaceae bacterium]
MASVSYRLGVIAAQAPEVLFRNLRSRYLALNDAIAATVAGQTHIRYLDKLGLLCDRAAQRCDLIGPSGKPIIYDSAHMTLEGIDILGARIRAAGWFE